MSAHLRGPIARHEYLSYRYEHMRVFPLDRGGFEEEVGKLVDDMRQVATQGRDARIKSAAAAWRGCLDDAIMQALHPRRAVGAMLCGTPLGAHMYEALAPAIAVQIFNEFRAQLLGSALSRGTLPFMAALWSLLLEQEVSNRQKGKYIPTLGELFSQNPADAGKLVYKMQASQLLWNLGSVVRAGIEATAAAEWPICDNPGDYFMRAFFMLTMDERQPTDDEWETWRDSALQEAAVAAAAALRD